VNLANQTARATRKTPQISSSREVWSRAAPATYFRNGPDCSTIRPLLGKTERSPAPWRRRPRLCESTHPSATWSGGAGRGRAAELRVVSRFPALTDNPRDGFLGPVTPANGGRFPPTAGCARSREPCASPITREGLPAESQASPCCIRSCVAMTGGPAGILYGKWVVGTTTKDTKQTVLLYGVLSLPACELSGRHPRCVSAGSRVRSRLSAPNRCGA
jgi:hypothetical protein